MPPETHDAGEISFRPVTPADLPLLCAWMVQPHWREWWGDPDVKLASIRDKIEGRDPTEPYLFVLEGQPVGYVQVWFIADARVEPWLTEAPWVMWLPDNAVGVDISLGDGAMLSRGIGSAALAAFVARLRAQGRDFIIIDPDPANSRAIAAYRKAGFRPIPELLGKTGPALIMRHVTKDDIE